VTGVPHATQADNVLGLVLEAISRMEKAHALSEKAMIDREIFLIRLCEADGRADGEMCSRELRRLRATRSAYRSVQKKAARAALCAQESLEKLHGELFADAPHLHQAARS